MTKPTLLYDGECGFCSLWIERWRATTGDRVDYVTWQEAAPRFPEISESRICRSCAVGWLGRRTFVGSAGRFRSPRDNVGIWKNASIALP